jgi:uncharacterized protein (DUF1499 family)
MIILAMASGIVVLGVGGATLALRIYLGRDSEGRLHASDIVDFSVRRSADRSNVYAMCPAHYCTPEADRESPVFAMPWERLRDYWQEVTATQPRVTEVGADPPRRHIVYIQRSAVLRFPDIVTVEFVPLGAERSSLAVDSRSRYGRGDFGVNRRRVATWMRLLQQVAAPEQ